jgi:transcription elongation factor Elf1
MSISLAPAETTHELLGFATCPSCRATDASMTYDALGKDSDWQCARCGQKWSVTRLATVAAYAAWVSGQTDLGRST